MNFQQPLLQSSVSQDPSEIWYHSWICWFAAHETFPIFTDEKGCAASYFVEAVINLYIYIYIYIYIYTLYLFFSFKLLLNCLFISSNSYLFWLLSQRVWSSVQVLLRGNRVGSQIPSFTVVHLSKALCLKLLLKNVSAIGLLSLRIKVPAKWQI